MSCYTRPKSWVTIGYLRALWVSGFPFDDTKYYFEGGNHVLQHGSEVLLFCLVILSCLSLHLVLRNTEDESE